MTLSNYPQEQQQDIHNYQRPPSKHPYKSTTSQIKFTTARNYQLSPLNRLQQPNTTQKISQQPTHHQTIHSNLLPPKQTHSNPKSSLKPSNHSPEPTNTQRNLTTMYSDPPPPSHNSLPPTTNLKNLRMTHNHPLPPSNHQQQHTIIPAKYPTNYHHQIISTNPLPLRQISQPPTATR